MFFSLTNGASAVIKCTCLIGLNTYRCFMGTDIYIRNFRSVCNLSFSLTTKTVLAVKKSTFTMFSVFIWPILFFYINPISEETQGRFCSCCCTCERNFVFPFVRYLVLASVSKYTILQVIRKESYFSSLSCLGTFLSAFFWSAFTNSCISKC